MDTVDTVVAVFSHIAHQITVSAGAADVLYILYTLSFLFNFMNLLVMQGDKTWDSTVTSSATSHPAMKNSAMKIQFKSSYGFKNKDTDPLDDD